VRYATARNPEGIGWPPSRSEAASRSHGSSSARLTQPYRCSRGRPRQIGDGLLLARSSGGPRTAREPGCCIGRSPAALNAVPSSHARETRRPLSVAHLRRAARSVWRKAFAQRSPCGRPVLLLARSRRVGQRHDPLAGIRSPAVSLEPSAPVARRVAVRYSFRGASREMEQAFVLASDERRIKSGLSASVGWGSWEAPDWLS
jgi:hypothetical protein